ncbi:MAG: hypothetical protein ACLQEQ_05825 [Nitrososphaerales archaeon]
MLLILVGIGLGEYLLYLVGFFLLFPALLLSPKPRPQGTPTGSGQQPIRRTSPQPAPAMGTASTPAPSQTHAPASMPPIQASPVSYSQISSGGTSYNPSLFPTSMFPSASQPTPTSMFPSASQPTPTAQPPKEARSEAPASRDDVLELGALLVLMKLVFG